MEAFIGLVLLVLVVASLIFYKEAIKKTSKYVDDVVTTNISEVQTTLIKRSQVAYDKLIEECGEDFMTPQQIYNRMMKYKTINKVK